MIKSFTPRGFDGDNKIPSYATKIKRFTLLAELEEGYVITLAKLSVGESVSAGNQLTHASFESFDDHGRRKAAVRTRVSGYNREFVAVQNAMIGAGVEFAPVTPCTSEDMLNALGNWFREHNPDIKKCSLVSQRCH